MTSENYIRFFMTHNNTSRCRSKKSKNAACTQNMASSVGGGNSRNEDMSSPLRLSGDGTTVTTARPSTASDQRRNLQGFQVPDYTSPPLQDALDATPVKYRDDSFVDNARAAAAANECGGGGGSDGDESSNAALCQIFIEPDEGQFDTKSQVGVIIYGGGLVDPRAYSPLARVITSRYGMPVAIPIFEQDLAYPFSCYTGRIELANQRASAAAAAAASKIDSSVRKWVLVGHSLGGSGAMVDLTTIYQQQEERQQRQGSTEVEATIDDIAGLVLLASGSSMQSPCAGQIEFSQSDLPMAVVTASEDLILNKTAFEKNKMLRFNQDQAFFMEILGGNHGQFGSYDSSERKSILNQTDGDVTIPRRVQLDLSASAIHHVASRSGLSIPQRVAVPPVLGEAATSHGYHFPADQCTSLILLVVPFMVWVWK